MIAILKLAEYLDRQMDLEFSFFSLTTSFLDVRSMENHGLQHLIVR